MTHRTVTHGYTPDQFTQLCAVCSPGNVFQAIGYLSTWGMEAHPHVNLGIMASNEPGACEILAYYRKEPGGPVTYAIGAVWHGDHFGFHS